MKRAFLILCAALSLQACGSNDSSSYVIHGAIDNPQEGGMVKLEEINGSNLKAIDSVQVDKDGKFTLNGSVPEEGFYRLNFFDKKAVTFVLGNQTIKVKADGADPAGEVKVEGSKSTDLLRRVDALRADFQVKVSGLEQQYVMAVNSKDESKQESLKEQYQKLAEENSTVVKQLIDSMGTNIIALYAVNLLNPQEELAYLEKVADRFAKEKPNSKYTKEYIEALNNFKNANGQDDTGDLAIGAQAPDIKLTDPNGKVVTLSSLKGKYVLIDFWASWCGPCRQENPNVVRLYNQYKDKGFEIYGVSLDQDKGKWIKAIEKDKLTWVHVSDLKGWQSSAAELYHIDGIPATYLLDKEGKIIAKNLRGKALENKLAEILN